MGSLIFKGAARGLYSEDHASRDFPLIFHMEYSVYSIGTVLIFLTGAMIQVTQNIPREEFIVNTLSNIQ